MGKFIHGLKKTRRYEVWCGMKKRCYNKNSPRYKDYGGRGIIVCKLWQNSFQAFYNWSERNGYQKHLTIDRINNNGDYNPSNCRWVTNQENCDNGRRQKKIFINGETTTIRQLSNKTGIKYKTIMSRMNMGWDLNDVFTLPVGSRKPIRYRDVQGKFTKPPF